MVAGDWRHFKGIPGNKHLQQLIVKILETCLVLTADFYMTVSYFIYVCLYLYLILHIQIMCICTQLYVYLNEALNGCMLSLQSNMLARTLKSTQQFPTESVFLLLRAVMLMRSLWLESVSCGWCSPTPSPSPLLPLFLPPHPLVPSAFIPSSFILPSSSLFCFGRHVEVELKEPSTWISLYEMESGNSPFNVNAK